LKCRPCSGFRCPGWRSLWRLSVNAAFHFHADALSFMSLCFDRSFSMEPCTLLQHGRAYSPTKAPEDAFRDGRGLDVSM
jgi:hypothetical protein